MELTISFLRLIILLMLICQFLSLSLCSNEENTTLEEMFKLLIRDNPTIVLLDDTESDLEIKIRASLESVDNAGSVVFTFNPWWKFWKQRLKPRIGAGKSTPFRWTFICLIEEKRTKARADKYLEELLSIGNGRQDRFILLGLNHHISIFLKSTQVDHFLNIMGISVDKNFVYQQNIKGSVKGISRFRMVTNLKSVRWVTNQTSSLNGQHFRISGTRFPPYMDWVYNEKGGVQLMGQNYRIFHEGSLYHNYTYEFNPVSKWKLTGKRYLNGTWDGVYGDLLYGKADIASVSTQTVDRNGLADFVGPFGRAHLVFVTSPPEKHVGKYTIFRSYTVEVWGIILVFFAVFVVLFYKAFQHSVSRGMIKHKGSLLSKAALLVWSLSFEQTEEKRPKGIRLLMIMWVAFIVVIGTGYRSNLAASISLPQPEQKPKTFQQLSEQINYDINFDLSGISAWTHFEASNNPLLRKIRDRSIKMENTSECVITSFMDKNTVCIGWDFTLKYAAAKNMTIPQLKYPLTESIEAVWAAWYTFALPKNSKFTEAFQHIGQTIFEMGLTAYWRERLLNSYRWVSLNWSNSQVKTNMYNKLEALRRSGKSDSKPLEIENVEFVFIILMAGLFVSFVRFTFEVWTNREGLLRNRCHYAQPILGRHRKITFVQSNARVIPIDYVP